MQYSADELEQMERIIRVAGVKWYIKREDEVVHDFPNVSEIEGRIFELEQILRYSSDYYTTYHLQSFIGIKENNIIYIFFIPLG